jgi:DNA polymerase-3 subunit epsilon
MAHAFGDHCGCFPTGLPYPGIADLLLRAPSTPIGIAAEFDVDTSLTDLPLAVIDTETTGRDPARGDRIIEIAIVYFDRGAPTARHALLVDPGMPIPADSTAVHGITDADVRGKPRFDGIARDVLGLLAGRIPVAYNASFDRTFIFSEMRKAGFPPGTDRALPPAMRSNVEWIDPLVWARAVQPNAKGYKLGEVAARLDVSLVQAHRATDDAEAAGHVLIALFRSQGRLSYREAVQKQREQSLAFDRTRGNWRR